MLGLFDVYTLFILTIIGVALLGLAAGFSPTLYIAQAASTRSKAAKQRTVALILGVVVAIIVLLSLFQSLTLATLKTVIDSTLHALLFGAISNSIIGLLFILAGVYYIRTQDIHQAYTPHNESRSKKARSAGAFFGLGFVKTLLSVSGATAVYIAGNLIGTASQVALERIVYTAVFLAAVVAPFIAVFIILRKHPRVIHSSIEKIKNRLEFVNYRLTVGVGAIMFGLAIIAFHSMMALFY